jgi:putative endonuclease
MTVRAEMGAQMQADIRADRGMRSHLAGLAAEDAVARHYDLAGRFVCARRWRGQWGEIDLIARDGNQLVLIEVKQSRTHDEAMSHITQSQVERVFHAAAEYVEGEPAGAMTDLRFDLAVVDAVGRVVVHENFWVN